MQFKKSKELKATIDNNIVKNDMKPMLQWKSEFSTIVLSRISFNFFIFITSCN